MVTSRHTCHGTRAQCTRACTSLTAPTCAPQLQTKGELGKAKAKDVEIEMVSAIYKTSKGHLEDVFVEL